MMSRYIIATCFIAGFFCLQLHLSCSRYKCDSSPRPVTSHIGFELKSQATGNHILSATNTTQPAPDSIKLKQLNTGQFYSLFIGSNPGGPVLYSNEYNRQSGVTDSLVFLFGNSIPDTLIVTTGLVDGWRGDECGPAPDAGIVKVTLRGQVLLQTTYDNSLFTIRK